MADTTCSIDGCEQRVKARGWCNMHWLRWKRTGGTGAVGRERRVQAATPDERRERRRKQMAEYRAADPEKHRAKWAAERVKYREQRSASHRLWRRKNAERIAAWGKAYDRDKVKKAASDKAYREANRERIAAYMLEYVAANRLRFREYGHRRSAAKRAAEGHATAEQIRARIDYYGGLCWICGAPWEHIDHVKPLAKGGCNWPANLRPACKSCNSRKKDVWPFAA